MNTRSIIKFSVFTITVLLADFTKELILKHIPAYHSASPYKSTAMSMLLAVIIFVPTFSFIDKYIKNTAQQYVRSSRVISGNRVLSVVLGLAVALVILYAGFLYVRYNIYLHKSVMGFLKF